MEKLIRNAFLTVNHGELDLELFNSIFLDPSLRKKYEACNVSQPVLEELVPLHDVTPLSAIIYRLYVMNRSTTPQIDFLFSRIPSNFTREEIVNFLVAVLNPKGDYERSRAVVLQSLIDKFVRLRDVTEDKVLHELSLKALKQIFLDYIQQISEVVFTNEDPLYNPAVDYKPLSDKAKTYLKSQGFLNRLKAELPDDQHWLERFRAEVGRIYTEPLLQFLKEYITEGYRQVAASFSRSSGWRYRSLLFSKHEVMTRGDLSTAYRDLEALEALQQVMVNQNAAILRAIAEQKHAQEYNKTAGAVNVDISARNKAALLKKESADNALHELNLEVRGRCRDLLLAFPKRVKIGM